MFCGLRAMAWVSSLQGLVLAGAALRRGDRVLAVLLDARGDRFALARRSPSAAISARRGEVFLLGLRGLRSWATCCSMAERFLLRLRAREDFAAASCCAAFGAPLRGCRFRGGRGRVRPGRQCRFEAEAHQIACAPDRAAGWRRRRAFPLHVLRGELASRVIRWRCEVLRRGDSSAACASSAARSSCSTSASSARSSRFIPRGPASRGGRR